MMPIIEMCRMTRREWVRTRKLYTYKIHKSCVGGNIYIYHHVSHHMMSCLKSSGVYFYEWLCILFLFSIKYTFFSTRFYIQVRLIYNSGLTFSVLLPPDLWSFLIRIWCTAQHKRVKYGLPRAYYFTVFTAFRGRLEGPLTGSAYIRAPRLLVVLRV